MTSFYPWRFDLIVSVWSLFLTSLPSAEPYQITGVWITCGRIFECLYDSLPHVWILVKKWLNLTPLSLLGGQPTAQHIEDIQYNFLKIKRMEFKRLTQIGIGSFDYFHFLWNLFIFQVFFLSDHFPSYLNQKPYIFFYALLSLIPHKWILDLKRLVRSKIHLSQSLLMILKSKLPSPLTWTVNKSILTRSSYFHVLVSTTIQ